MAMPMTKIMYEYVAEHPEQAVSTWGKLEMLRTKH
jgi:hypothetical protein